MTPLAIAAGIAVALGAALAGGAREPRAAAVGVVFVLCLGPFTSDPLPAGLSLAYRVVGGVLAAFLVLVASRGVRAPAGSPLGLPASLAAAAAAVAAGTGATALGIPAAGSPSSLAAGLACVALVAAPLAVARDAFRMATGIVVLGAGAILLRDGLAGTPGPGETLIAGATLVLLAVTSVALVWPATRPTDRPAIPELATLTRAVRGGRRP